MIDARVNKEYIDKIISIAKNYYDKVLEKNRDKEELEGMLSKNDFNNYPHLFVFACVMDSQIDADKAWRIPYIIADELGNKSFDSFLSKDLDWYKKIFNEKKLHRFNSDMAEAFYEAIQKIHIEYNNNAKNIWNDNPSSSQLVCRFLEFKRIGIKISTMAVNILSRDYGVKIADKYAIDISPDIHIKRAMYRLGLIPKINEVVFKDIDSTKIIYAAKSLNPTFPGVLDLICWKIGKDGICKNDGCNSKEGYECPFAKFCIRQQ